MDPPDPPPPPNLDPPLPASNVYILVVPGENPLNTFQRINVLSGLKATTVLPSKLAENKITVITLFYEKTINHSLALASTLLFKKAIEGEIKTGAHELGLVGLLDYNISFLAIAKKECAIWFNGVVDDSIIKCTLDLLLKAIGASHIAQEYGFVPPRRYEYKLYFMPYLLGFLREELEYSFTRAGYEPKHLKLLQGKNALNSGTNIVGTHGNVILKTEVGVSLSFIDVSTNRGVFNLSLEQKDFYGSSVPKEPTQSASTEHNWLFKTRLCNHHASGKKCYKGTNCPFAHGENELRTKQTRAKRVFAHATAPSTEGTATDDVQPGSGSAVVPEVIEVIKINDSVSKVIPSTEGTATDDGQLDSGSVVVAKVIEGIERNESDLMVVDEVQSSDGGGRLVPGSLSESGIVSATAAAMVVDGFIEKNAASTSVGRIDTATNLNATSPLVPALTNSAKKRKNKRAAPSPLEAAITKTCTTDLTAVGLTAGTLFAVPAYDIDFPISPTHTVVIPKGGAKERGISKSTPASTGPVFALNGKPVPSASDTGAFNYLVPIPKSPIIVKSGKGNNVAWPAVGVNKVVTTPGAAGVKTGKTASATTEASPPIVKVGSTTKESGSLSSTPIAKVGSTTKESVSPSATNGKAAIKVPTTSPLKQTTTPKPTSAFLKKPNGNMFQALSDSANCNGDLGTQ